MASTAGKRLVIFGCGYIGSAVAREAVARGLQVTALTRNAATAQALRGHGIEAVIADLADHAWHGAVAGEADYALNCVSSGGAGLEGYRRSYVEGMRSVLAWAQRNPPGTLVYTSSTSVYPQGGGMSVDETAPVESPGANERAGILVQAEELLRGAGNPDTRWFILRCAGIYGPAREHLVAQVRMGEVSGDPTRHLNLAHRDDVVAAIFACFAAPVEIRNEVFNVVDDAPTPKSEVVRWLAERLQVTAPRFTGEAAFGRGRITPDRFILNRKLRERLGWRPKYPSFREGYTSVLAY